jgi:hypothetical protein
VDVFQKPHGESLGIYARAWNPENRAMHMSGGSIPDWEHFVVLSDKNCSGKGTDKKCLFGNMGLER